MQRNYICARKANFMNHRLVLEKKDQFQVHKAAIEHDIQHLLDFKEIQVKHLFIIYDVFNCSEEQYNKLKDQILLDVVTDVEVDVDFSELTYFAEEPLPGQFDPRANSAEQCLHLIGDAKNVSITSAKAYVLSENTSDEQLQVIQEYFVNPVESRLKDLTNSPQLAKVTEPKAVEQIEGFISWNNEELAAFKQEQGFAMSVEDIAFIQEYFKSEEQRDPSETEIKVLDTYWSDHCRHTTFFTEITDVKFEEGAINEQAKKAFEQYKATRKNVYGERIAKKPISLMDLATLAAKDLKQRGILTTVEESDEINACSVYTKVQTEQGEEDWLLMFKNETHNHPTEIEPYGGASTCLGGCIRDPLSGRAYVYQAMRVSGAANVLEPIHKTLEGKLPQQKITQEAASGFSSYGNQIGLATTHVAEVYHPGYQAKRMEVGAVVAAAPESWVKREQPLPGDVILLLGGKTGRDGVGGATGSSKEHTEESLETAGAEVQKGNPPEERKIQRFFRNGEVTSLIKKCNDFGAGGVSVAIGELADGLLIDLNKIPTKYSGLNGTELALSESQERMAVVLAKEDVEQFQQLAAKENLEVSKVAEVTATNRLQMQWNNELIVDISRDFLDTNGVSQQATVVVQEPKTDKQLFNQEIAGTTIIDELTTSLRSLNMASQQGLVEQFDSTIGSSTIHMPFGGKYQLTPAEGSLQSFPTLNGQSSTCSALTWGFDADISSYSPFLGGAYAVIHSLAKLVAMGANAKSAYFTFQEYFKKLNSPQDWGLPFSALLGAYNAQQAFECAAIGGKDSMSGTFHDIHVPPTLISFAVATIEADKTISSELKRKESNIYVLLHEANEDHTPNYEQLKNNFALLHQLNAENKILSAATVKKGGIASTLCQMAFGNKIGFELTTDVPLFSLLYGSIIIESKEELNHENLVLIGQTNETEEFLINEEEIEIAAALKAWQSTLEPVFPTVARQETKQKLDWKPSQHQTIKREFSLGAQPRVFIPAFPGTNCEYDSELAFQKAGAKTQISVFKNGSSSEVEQSLQQFVDEVNNSQILMLSGGFSAGDEPDGSGKFITAVLQNERVKEAIEQLLERDGLILGVCNGFQALVKSGILPFGKVLPKQPHFPTLASNQIGRHISQIVRTKVVSTKSPWLADYTIGDEHQIAISHGEGRFVVSDELANELFANGQIATQYVNLQGEPTMQRPYNPNGSYFAIEGITSADGKIFGKMGHSERAGKHLYQNIPGEVGQDIFTNGVKYFK